MKEEGKARQTNQEQRGRRGCCEQRFGPWSGLGWVLQCNAERCNQSRTLKRINLLDLRATTLFACGKWRSGAVGVQSRLGDSMSVNPARIPSFYRRLHLVVLLADSFSSTHLMPCPVRSVLFLTSIHPRPVSRSPDSFPVMHFFLLCN